MGFFKSIGNKLKRVISIKNLTNVVTGKFSAVGADVVRVATTKSPAEIQAEKDAAAKANIPLTVDIADNSLIPADSQIPEIANAIMDSKGAELNKKLVGALSKTKVAQNATDLVVSTAIKAFWEKHKNWIIGFVVAVVLFFVGKKLFFSKGSRSGSRR